MARTYGVIVLFLAACSFGTAAIFIKLAYRAGLQPAGLLTLQNLVSIACLWPMMLAFVGFPRLGRRQAGRIAGQGLFGNFAISVCYFWGVQRIDVSLLSIIMFTYPGLVLLYQMTVERHRASMWEFLALLMSGSGVVLAIDPFQEAAAGSVDVPGLLFAAGTAAASAFLIICGQKLALDLPALTVTALTATVSTVALMAVLRPSHWFSLEILKDGWEYIGIVAVLSTVLPMNLLYLGLRRINAFHASIISVAELPCILVLAYFILNEQMRSGQLLGGSMILVSFLIIKSHRPSAIGYQKRRRK